MRFHFTLVFVLFSYLLFAQDLILEVNEGNAYFVSEAPLELIEAQSNHLKGLLEPETGKFAFVIPVQSFEGFNSPTQREHFRENFLETDKYPNATFSGKLIEKIDLREDGTYQLRAKGKFTVHGVVKELIIRCTIHIQNGKWDFESKFSVRLEDHNITIPKIVNQKISEEIQVSITGKLEEKRT
ncbi:MAG: YceI family protein [Saprospiraceae bacterium]|nr:YceI family protein [Saprospiraceae bacterium]